MASPQFKKIIVGCDGTWLNSEYGFSQKSYLPWGNPLQGTLVTPSNVTRMCRALQLRKSATANTQPLQIVDYKPGFASSTNFWDHFVNGATGMDIAENMREAYGAVQEKWAPGDEIYLIGFSRGAFVARSVATMICGCGMLNKDGMEDFYDIFLDWQNANNRSWTSRKYPGRGLSFQTGKDGQPSTYSLQLQQDGLAHAGVRIKAVAVFDTVGALGVPTLGSFKPTRDFAFINTEVLPNVDNCFQALGVPTLGSFKPTRDFAFINTEVLPNVDNCFQALALDEMRVPFSPTLWEIPQELDGKVNLKQCWFPGCHADIGGSIDDAEVPNIALAWMIQQLAPFLDFDEEYLKFLNRINQLYYEKHRLPVRDWGMGYIYNPFSGIEIFAGRASRTPGRYQPTDYWTGKKVDRPLRNTNESIHPSIRVRIVCHGKGVSDSPDYNPKALSGYTLQTPPNPKKNDPMQEGYSWLCKDSKQGITVTLPEWKMDGFENMLFDISPRRSLL